jgi:hypothetical protein
MDFLLEDMGEGMTRNEISLVLKVINVTVREIHLNLAHDVTVQKLPTIFASE